MTSPCSSNPDEGDCRNVVDRWFRTLDRRRIDLGGQSWTAEIVGIHVDGANLWIQISSMERADSAMVLHMPASASVDEVIAAMQTAPPGDTVHGQRVRSLLPAPVPHRSQ